MIEKNRRGGLKVTAAAVLSLAIAAGVSAFQLKRSEKLENQYSFQKLKAGFANPDIAYKSAPLWVWNTRVDETIIDSMLVDFKNNDFGGVMVHPRPGLITEYLSDDWFRLFRYTVQKGKQIGLQVWIYDENSYPSGFAGGLLPAAMPESYNQGQMLHLTKVTTLPDDLTHIFIAFKEEKGVFKDITETLATEKGRNANYYLFNKESYKNEQSMVGPEGFPYVDLLAKGVTEKFLEVTMTGYKKVLGSEFGKSVPGLFSDEPNIMTRGAGNIRWTPDLFEVFKDTWGYDLRQQLVSLYEEVGDWKRVRHNYMTVLSQMFIDRWSKPMYEYTSNNNLKWTGHYWEHGWPNPNDIPDNMAMYAWHHVPGIDMLFNQFDEISPNAQFGNIRAVKELSSVANQLNKERTLSETYGGGGWELTFKDMKRLCDWQYALGVNFLNQHLAFMSIAGARKYDYPQSFSYHSPWWENYKYLNSYYGRLSFALSQGQQKNDILIIEPTTAAWMYWSFVQKHKRFSEIGNSFQQFVTKLEKAQVEYDLGSENIIKDHGQIVNGKFKIGSRSYSTVVIPPGMENADEPTFRLLKDFVAKGGRLLLFEDLNRIDGRRMPDGESLVARANIHKLDTLSESVLNYHFRSPNFTILQSDVASEKGNLYHNRREFKDGQLLFLSNASMDASSRGKIEILGRDVLLLDPFTGEISDYPDNSKGNMLEFSYDIPPAGSRLFFISDADQNSFKPYRLKVSEKVVSSTEPTVVRPRENTLMIDFCDLTVGNELKQDIHVVTASNFAFNKHGFRKNPWDHKVQYKDRIVARDTFSRGTGFTATYRFTIEKGVKFKDFKAVAEQRNLWKTISINGKVVNALKDKWWLDRSFGVFNVGQYLEEGENTLTLHTDPMSVYAEIQPVYILGNFNVSPAEKGWTLSSPSSLKLGSWKDQGLPLYGHSVSYKKKVHLPSLQDEYEVQLGNWKGPVAAVKVNGSRVGIIYSEPNSLPITSYLKKGDNIIEVEITGSLKNLLGPHHNSPRPGLVSPWQWANVKSIPAGAKYDLYDYGLMEDFKILNYKME